MPILTQFPITRRFWRLTLLFALSGFRLTLPAQCSLSCNQGLQISLGPSGQALITPLLIAPNAGNSCPGPLTVTLYDNIGQQLPNPLTCAQIGQTVTAWVRHTSSGNFCTGTLELFDVLPPTLSNCGDKFVFCNEDTAPEAVGFPMGTDNCTASGDLNFIHFDTETPLGCGNYQSGQQVLKRIDRSWTASDEHGNSSTCLQKIWLKHITFADIEFPANRDNISAPALSCGQDPEDLDITGQPTVNGIPIGASPECEMAVTYSDQTIYHCAPAGFTVLRNWTAIDFCSGTFSFRTQIIKVEDKEAPVLTAPDDLTVGTDGFYCTGSVELPPAVVSDNCSDVTVQPSWDYGSGYGPFSSIAIGPHLVTYVATDACGNSTTATMTVTVEDTSPPQAICAADLQVSVSNNGAGYVNASTVGLGSFDNCGPVFLSISRDEVEYTPQVVVTCEDQDNPLLLTLKVTDAVGLENLCQVEVTVRDFLKPSIQCPPNLTLTCLQDYNDLNLTGQATASDNCALQSIEHQDFANIQPCNIGSVTRWWVATDSAANTKSCSQAITVNVVSNTSVAFPADISVNECSDPANTLPPSTGQPIIGGQSCSPLSVNYTDQIFSIAPPSCYRIFRSWKVIDHCIYNPNGGTAGIWEHLQIIDIVDNTPPVLSISTDLTVAADPFNCLGSVNMPDATALDCSSQVTFAHNSVFSGAGNSNNASGQYPLGLHFVTFTATDACGNSAQKTLKITVRDLSPPTAVCLPGVSAAIQVSGSVTLNPQNFDGGCSDFCSPQNSLAFSIAPSVFDCQEIGLHPVTLTVQDTAGNSASCNTQVLIQDNLQVCGGGLVHQVDGTIRTEAGLPVNNIEVSLTGDGFLETVDCDTSGYFGFSDIPTSASYILRPFNNSNWLNGVTTFDLVLISKHILGVDTLESPYRMLAADANQSGSITTFDIVQLRKLILGISDSLPSNTSWRFVDSTYVFPNLENPFSAPIPEQIVFNPLNSNQSAQNFVGLKVGDVNASTNPAEARSWQDTLYLEVPSPSFRAGETLEIPISLQNWAGLEGLQFELSIDPALLQLESVEFAQPEILGHPHAALREGGILAISWDNAEARPRAVGDVMLSLRCRALAGAPLQAALKISDVRLNPEAYRLGEEAPAALAIRILGQNTGVLRTDLEIFPNPNSGDFFVKNSLREEECTFRVKDPQGKLIFEQTGFLPEIIPVHLQASLVQGCYFLEWQNSSETKTGKVVVTR